MKNKNIKLLTILSAGALVMGLASCGENTNSSAASEGTSETSSEVQSSETPSSSSVTKTPKRIKNNGVDTVVSGVEFDLDDTITILYDDDSSDHNYTVTSSSDDVSISGHLITIKGHGEYSLLVTAGTLKSRVSVTVVSEEHKALIDFLEPLSETPQNYTLQVCDWDDNGYLTYGGETVVHNENYIAIYDETDPTGVYPSTSKYAGEPTSTLLAKLSDGHAYWGYLAGTNDNIKPTFEPGYASWSNYYITGDLSIDALDATYQTSGTSEYLMMSTAFEAAILNYGLSNFPDNYGYSYAGAIYEGLGDTDDDGIADTAVFDLMVSTSEGKMGLWTAIAISNIGTSKLDFMETATTDPSYLPVKVTSEEIGTVFGKLAEVNNFTMTTEIYSANSDGTAYTPKEDDDWYTDTMSLWTGTPSIKFTTTYTSNGVISVAETKKLSQDSSTSKIVVADDYSLSGKFAIYDDGADTYISEYDATASAMGEATKTVEGKKAYESGLLDGMAASGITTAVANGTIWSKKLASGTATTFSGSVGDNNGKEANNELFGKLLDMNGFSWNLGGTTTTFGDAWTSSEDWGSAYHALSLGLTYQSFTVDSATNEVSAFITGYLPINFDVTQNNSYIAIKITISNVGTTTNDFTFGASSGTEAE